MKITVKNPTCKCVFMNLYLSLELLTGHKFRAQKAFLPGKIDEHTKGGQETCSLHWQTDKCL